MSLAIPKTNCSFCQKEWAETPERGFKLDAGDPMPADGETIAMLRFQCDCGYEVTIPKALVAIEASRRIRDLFHPDRLPPMPTMRGVYG